MHRYQRVAEPAEIQVIHHVELGLGEIGWSHSLVLLLVQPVLVLQLLPGILVEGALPNDADEVVADYGIGGLALNFLGINSLVLCQEILEL